MNHTFLGKWTFDQSGTVVQTDAAGALVIKAAPVDGSDRFNIYGSTAGFVIQSAANGQYLVRSGTAYKAGETDRTKANVFKTETTTAPAFRIVDLGVGGTGTPELWNAQSGAIVAVASSSPPATTVFGNTVVTVGIDKIIASGFSAPHPDMNWVDISGTDLSKIPRTNFDLSGGKAEHANLSNCSFPANISFDQARCKGIDLSGATLDSPGCGNVDFTDAKLDGAKMQAITLTSATCDGMSAVKTDMSTTPANFGATVISDTSFTKATLDHWTVANGTAVSNCDFTGASLQYADFTGINVQGQNGVKVEGADLTGVKLHNTFKNGQVITTVFPGVLRVDNKTNFTNADISYVDLTGYDLSEISFAGANMTGCKLDKTQLDLADLAYATLDGATLTGTVTLHGANLSNASLKGCDLSGAQLGAVSLLFAVAQSSSSPDYQTLLTALQDDDTATVTQVFGANGVTLTGTVTISKSGFSDKSWTVSTSASQITYAVDLVTVGGVNTIEVGTRTAPAVLSNAFLVNTKFNNANLIGVNASGAALYSINSQSNGMNKAQFRDMQLANSNLSNQSFASITITGVNFDFAILSNANFNGATLGTSSTGLRTSFNGANLLSAKFDGATLNDTVFTNSAFGIGNPKDSNPKNTPVGAWLFSIPAAEAAGVVGELNAAQNVPNQTPPNQFTIPATHLSAFDVPGKPAAGIVSAFSANGITLAGDALLTISGETVFWQINDAATPYVIMEAVDTSSGQPVLGVAAGTAYSVAPTTFLPLSMQSDLIAGKISPALHKALAAAGITVSATATLNMAQQPSDWQIVNGAPCYEVFNLWLDLSAFGTVIQVRPSLSGLIASFSEFSTALSTRATILQLLDSATHAQIGWIIDNNSGDPFNPVTNYVLFRVLQNSDMSLDVYGGLMRVKRLSSEGSFEYANIVAGITTMIESQLAGSGNVAPNGEFSSTNTTNKLPFNAWLRPRVPPRPPLCVPDPSGNFICPT